MLYGITHGYLPLSRGDITALSQLVTSAEEGGYVFGAVCLSVCLSVCLYVRQITRKLVNGF